jgi:hypothetical protein
MRAVAQPISEPGLENYYLGALSDWAESAFAIMPALVAGIHVFLACLQREGVVLKAAHSSHFRRAFLSTIARRLIRSALSPRASARPAASTKPNRLVPSAFLSCIAAHHKSRSTLRWICERPFHNTRRVAICNTDAIAFATSMVHLPPCRSSALAALACIGDYAQADDITKPPRHLYCRACSGT